MTPILKRAIKRVESLLDPRQYPPEHPHLHALLQVCGGESILRRISLVSDVEGLRDCLAEVNSTLTFVGLGFKVEADPLGSKGPDLRVRIGRNSLLVEVSRLRLKHEMPVLDPSEEPLLLADLGDPLDDVRRAFQKICNKLPQLSSQPGILLIWDDDEVLDELHAATAAHWLREHFESGSLKHAEHLEFIALHVNWVRPESQQEFFTWSIHQSQQSWITQWRAMVEAVRLRDALTAALGQLDV